MCGPGLRAGEGSLYLAAVLDLATRKIVGWSMREHRRAALSVAVLMMAAQRQRPDAWLICHSDRGSPYAAGAYRRQLASMQAARDPSTRLHRKGSDPWFDADPGSRSNVF